MSEGHAVADTQVTEQDRRAHWLAEVQSRRDAVLDEQQRLVEMEDRLQAMQTAIAERRSNIEGLKVNLPDFAALERAHDDMLARHAIGEVTDAELQAQQAIQADAHESARLINADIGQAGRAVEALEKMCGELKASIAKSREEKKEKVCRLLLAEAQVEAMKYVQATRDIELSYLRLRALNLMFLNRSGRDFLKRGEPLRVPDFDLDACNLHRKPVALNALCGFDDRFDRNKVLAAAVFEIKVLRDESGILLQDDDSGAPELIVAAREGLAT